MISCEHCPDPPPLRQPSPLRTLPRRTHQRLCIVFQAWWRFGSTFRTWRGPKASWSSTKSRCWWSRWDLGRGRPWAPWDHSTTCTTCWRSALTQQTHTHTHTGTLSCHSVSGAFICGVGLWPLPLPLTPLPPTALLTPRDHWRGKTTVARACCVTPRGVGQLWLVYCQQSHWGLGAQGQSECWSLLDSSTFKAQGTSQHGEWKGEKKTKHQN